MENAIDIWPVLAGLGLFLFGMHMLEEAIKKTGGRSFKLFLRKQADNRFRGVFSGALITALLQSSSMVILLVMSFTGAGVFQLHQGISVLLGVNLGTTFTGWLVTLIGFKLDIGALIMPFIAVGGLGNIFFKNEKLSQISKLIMGFSLMFLGLAYMKDGFVVFADMFDADLFTGKNFFLYFLIGFALAAAIQSSSASGMIFLTSLSSGIITLDDAVYLMIGADLGTTVTAIIGTLGGNSIKRKIGWSHFIFNFYNSILSLSLAGVYLFIIRAGLGISDVLIGFVTFHSFSQFVGIMTVLPFLKYFVKFIDNRVAQKEKSRAGFLTLANPLESISAFEALKQESSMFFKRVLTVNAAYFGEGRAGSNPAFHYSGLKEYENEIVQFYLKLQQTALREAETDVFSMLIESVRHASFATKELKNVKHNLDELSNSAQSEFHDFYAQIKSRQLAYYTELERFADDLDVLAIDDLEHLDEMQKMKFRQESQEVYELYKKHPDAEIQAPSLLNLIRQLNNSIELLYRSLYMRKEKLRLVSAD